MKNNISKVFLNTLITLGILFSINNVSALTIKETVNSNDNYDTIYDGSIIIGITKFEPNVVLTGKRISTATYNDVMFKYGTPNYDGVDIYYYLSGDWYKLDDENSVNVLDAADPMVEKLNNPDIYYVNNDEKMLEIPYSNELAPGYELVFKTDNSKKDKDVKYVDGKILLPATISNIDIYVKETATNVEEILDSFSKVNSNDVVLEKSTYLDLSSSIEEKSNNLINTYYNKYSNGNLITNVNDDVYYVTLGEYVGSENPSELKIGGNTYDTKNKSLSIGNNAFVEAPVWKIKEGKVLVALTWLSADALPDKATKVEIGGQTFEVTVYSASVEGSTVTISGASGIYGPAGYASEATINGNTVDFRYTHGATALGIKLKVGGVEITEANKVIFRKATDGNMGLTTTESNGYTYAVYFKYANEAIGEAKDYVKEYKLAIPGEGVISVTLNGHAVPSL